MAISAAQRKKFIKLIKELNTLLKEIRKTEPQANYYLEEDNMHLMKGPDHYGRDGEVRGFDNIVVMVRMPNSGGGAW